MRRHKIRLTRKKGEVMIIHTIKPGENLYGIARKYSVPATKIWGDNDLWGDRITVGDELLVLIPTRTETVRAKDTLEGFSKRFGVRKEALLMANPALMGRDRLRPGQVITIKHDQPTMGIGSTLGFISKGCSRERLRRALPYTTYLVTCASVIDNDGIKNTFDGRWVKELYSSERKIHLLGIDDTTNGEFLRSKSFLEKVIDGMISRARNGGYNGICINARSAAHRYGEEFCEFILSARKRFIGCDLLLFTEIYDTTPKDASELSDGAILHLADRAIDETRLKLNEFSNAAESSKVFVNITSKAKVGNHTVSLGEAKELCYRSGLSLKTDNDTLISSFTYTRYKTGEGERLRVEIPSLEYTKAKLEHLCELGFIGISFDADTVGAATLAMFSSMFARADYSVP